MNVRLVRVPVRGYTSGSFSQAAIGELMRRGEKAMLEKLDSVRVLKLDAGCLPGKDYSMHRPHGRTAARTVVPGREAA